MALRLDNTFRNIDPSASDYLYRNFNASRNSGNTAVQAANMPDKYTEMAVSNPDLKKINLKNLTPLLGTAVGGLASTLPKKKSYLKDSSLESGIETVGTSVASMNPLGSIMTGGTKALGTAIKGEGTKKSSVTLGDAVEGAGIGAGIGTMIAPGIGTAIGAGAGLLIGGLSSAFSDKAEKAKERKIKKVKKDAFSKQRFYARSGGLINPKGAIRPSSNVMYSTVKNSRFLEAEHGAKLGKNKPCGCDKNFDSIDTDVFHNAPKTLMTKIQKVIGTPQTGKYDPSADKLAMKKLAYSDGKGLYEYFSVKGEGIGEFFKANKMS